MNEQEGRGEAIRRDENEGPKRDIYLGPVGSKLWSDK